VLIAAKLRVARHKFVTTNGYFVPSRERSDIRANGYDGPAEGIDYYGSVIEAYDGFGLNVRFKHIERRTLVTDEDLSCPGDIGWSGAESGLGFDCWKVGCDVGEVCQCENLATFGAGNGSPRLCCPVVSMGKL
jgi:hypothetical protein